MCVQMAKICQIYMYKNGKYLLDVHICEDGKNLPKFRHVKNGKNFLNVSIPFKCDERYFLGIFYIVLHTLSLIFLTRFIVQVNPLMFSVCWKYKQCRFNLDVITSNQAQPCLHIEKIQLTKTK